MLFELIQGTARIKLKKNKIKFNIKREGLSVC
jgi:hypothetical protein